MTPAVSVVLPTHNRAAVLGRAIRSVLAQTFSDLELIVVDDGSDDGTENVVRQFGDPRLTYLHRSGRSGVAAARNAGIGAARGPLIAFQDSDDEWLIDKLARQVAALNAAPRGTGLICGGYIVLAADGRVTFQGPTPRMRDGDWGADNIHRFCFIAPTWLARREDLAGAGLFDEDLPNLEDWEFAFRLFRRCRIVALDQPLLVKHGSADGLNADRAARVRSLATIVERHGNIWSAHPSVLAELHRTRGHSQCAIGEMRAGRDSFQQAMRLDPRSLKPRVQWIASWGGRHAYLRLSRIAA